MSRRAPGERRAAPRWRRAVLAPIVVALTTAVGPLPPRAAAAASAGPAAQASWGRWSVPLSGEPVGLAADAHGVVVALQVDELVAFEPRLGRERWHARVGPVATLHRPAMDHDLVVVTTRTGHVAVARRDGAPRWSRTVADAGSATVAATGDGGRAVIAATNGGVVERLDPETGASRWSASGAGAIDTPPLLIAEIGVVVVVWHAVVGFLAALDLATGATRWRLPLGRQAGAPILVAGLVVLADGDQNFHARVRGVDPLDGTVRWTTPLPGSPEPRLEPGADGPDVAVVDHFGTLTLLDAASGTRRWQTATGAVLLATRVVLGPATVSFRTYHGLVLTCDRRDGTILRRRPDAGPVSDLTGVASGRPGDVDPLRLVVSRRLPGRLGVVRP